MQLLHRRKILATRLPEMIELQRLAAALEEYGRVETLAEIQVKDHTLPLIAITLGPQDVTTPVLAMFGGVHGLERVGTQLVNSYLNTIVNLIRWDETLNFTLKHVRLIFVPLVNPGGMYMRHRANPAGVDLMRNAPVEADDKHPVRLYTGHHISPKIPWFRGRRGDVMEPEARAVADLVRERIFPASAALSVDVHSGFGLVDRIWFPYAKTRRPIQHLPEVYKIYELLNQTFPHHVYRFEPQSLQYTTHGDLWDYLYDAHLEEYPDKVYLPLTMEMGSWNWVKKNPRQILSALGAFNPMIPHRHSRTMRRHLVLFEFLQRIITANAKWANLKEAERQRLVAAALDRWYHE